jgi:nitroimidazol reductase NimA-like FMN-containing flavoprotein (pyridoxamine 5'-phosphate oxidase superfamily)
MALTLDDIRKESDRFGRLAFVATVSPSGTPYASPVAVAWHGETILTFLASNEAKVANVRKNPRVSVHFSVSAETDWDSCVVWGDGRIVDDTAGRRGLWDKMGYDCNMFEPGGPAADTHVFLVIEPTRALILRNYGLKGRDSWRRR